MKRIEFDIADFIVHFHPELVIALLGLLVFALWGLLAFVLWGFAMWVILI